jgi:hypothetical protein
VAAAAQLVLQSGTGQDITVSANGAFSLVSPLAAGVACAVTVKTQPAGQTCVVAQGSGSVAAKVDNINVTCSTPLASGVPALLSETELCQLGDENPTLFASAASVLQSVQLSRDGSGYLKK